MPLSNQLENQLRLSFYKEIASINEKHRVSLVQHTETGKIYVLKRLNVYDKAVYEFLREHRFRGIPEIKEIIEERGILYVVEEYISGKPLREILGEKAPLSEDEALFYLTELCDILKPLHSAEPPIVHRDIKPENIIITKDNELVLVDFNSAKEIKSGANKDTELFGTPGYASPEQYGFLSSAPASDVYSAGVLLNEMLTGRLPSEYKYTGRLSTVIEKCIRLDPKDRYQNAEFLMEDILKVLRESDNSGQKNIQTLSKLDFLPPGFRKLRPVRMITSLLWYAFIVFFCFTVREQNDDLPITLGLRVCYFVIFVSETLWFGNYLHIWDRVSFSNSKNLPLKIFGIILWGTVILLIEIIIAGALAIV